MAKLTSWRSLTANFSNTDKLQWSLMRTLIITIICNLVVQCINFRLKNFNLVVGIELIFPEINVHYWWLVRLSAPKVWARGGDTFCCSVNVDGVVILPGGGMVTSTLQLVFTCPFPLMPKAR